MRLYYWIRAKYRRWNYKRKYGINIEDALLEYGRKVILTEAIVLKCCGKSPSDCVCMEVDDEA